LIAKLKFIRTSTDHSGTRIISFDTSTVQNLSDQLYSIIDVETTGGRPSDSRITDISIFITDGKQILDEFSSLVNPETNIPPFISELTGITNEMVADAPTYDQIAQRVLDFTEDTIFIAHNVNFDFAMINGEFSRLDYDFQKEKLCTVRLARKYIPGHRSYGLGNICGDLNIPINGRHRARGDAEATTMLFHEIFELSAGSPSHAPEAWLKYMPAHIPKEQVNSLPTKVGIYRLYDADNQILEVVACAKVKKEVISFLKSNSKRSKEIKAVLNRIEGEAQPSLLIAQLIALDEMEKVEPVFNSIKKAISGYQIVNYRDLFGYINLKIEKAEGVITSEKIYSTKGEANKALEKLILDQKLCAKLSGISKIDNCEKQICLGACRNTCTPDVYNLRVEISMKPSLKHPDEFMITHTSGPADIISFVKVSQGQLQGYGAYSKEDQLVHSVGELEHLMKFSSHTFEKAKAVNYFLENHKCKLIPIVYSQ
jgi:DNA polymerase-3 subunit epsilon